jgi:hypothetical protein
MGYKLLGIAVWKGGRWFLHRRYGHLVPSRRLVAAGVVVGVVSALAIAVARRESS